MSNKTLFITRDSRIIEKLDDLESGPITLNKMLRDGIDHSKIIDITDSISTGYIAPENGAISLYGKQKEYFTLVPEALFLLELYKDNKLVSSVIVDTKCLDAPDDVFYFITFIEKDMKIRLKRTYMELDSEYTRSFKFGPFKTDFNLKNASI